MKGQTRIMVAVGIGAAGILLLVYASIQASARQYVRIHQLTETPESYDGKRLKLSGEIMKNSVSFDAEQLKLRFQVKDVEGEGSEKHEEGTNDKPPSTEIVYEGPKPDGFTEGGVAIGQHIHKAFPAPPRVNH